MYIDFNNMMNLYNNPFFAGAFNPSAQIPASIFTSMPTFPTQTFDFSGMFNFNKTKFNFDFSTITTSNPSSSSSVREGHCRPNVKLDKAFLDKVKGIASRLGCDYKDLLAVMNSESGLNSRAVNKNGGATGLIQFMPSTARSLGTTTEELLDMTPIQQLDYVEKFLQRAKQSSGLGNKQHLTAGDLYAMVFLPGRATREVLTTAGEVYYEANKATDDDHDGRITKTELGNRLMRKRVDESIFA